MATAHAGRIGLLLPHLEAGIPVELHTPKATAANARIARFLLEANVVRERDVPQSWHNPLAVCEAALQRWLERHLGALRCLAPRFSISLMDREASVRSAAEAHPDRICIRWGEPEVLRWDIGAGLELLDRYEKGFGAAILAVMDAGSGRFYPLFTPRTALDAASFLYWHGEEDECLALAEMGESPEEQDAMRQEMVTLRSMQESFPGWALKPPSESAALALLRRVAACSAGPQFVQRAAAAAIDLARLPSHREYAPDVEGMFIGYGAVLCWRPDDVAMRISDDLAQYAWQDQYVDHAGEVSILLDDPASMRMWLRRMRNVLRGIALVDDLLWTLVEGY